ncbi:MAG: serine/threonine-protein kinase [Thermoanaerobaculia bacterium]|nr:serine/threonine-protein kinase [Thermoanaerobaculia bacterium]
MTSDWSRLRQLFEQSIELEPGERAEFLDSACAGDGELRAAVEQLIDADLAAGEFLDDPIVGRPPALSASGDAEHPATLGPYRVVRKLGQGGMGEVYLAVRDDPFQRRVVVKVVRKDLESPDLLRRLHAERQILAGLDHPHIAHLYDGGTTDDQRPYFVMEYVEGVPIVRYCDENRLSVEERIGLFRKVCGAVQYAHQNLVVHRDLKPSNILVTAEGEPKLLDFGIAKVLHPVAAPAQVDVTATWQRMLTPQYASPEQVRGNLVTTASDIYSLGVLLFELLTGRYPFSFARRSPQEIERILTEEEPPRPSAVVLTDSESSGSPGTTTLATELARARGTPPRELGRRLAGDLDSIVLKALRSAPHRRYPSAESMAADLERFQEGLPVTARRGTATYRLSRFLSRHRVAASMTALVASLLIFVAVTSFRQSQRLAEERDRALLEQSRKDTVMALLLDVLSVADPYSEEGAKLTVREALEASRQPMQRRLKDEPALRAELLHTTGVVLRNLGLWNDAKTDLEEAVRLRRSLHGEGHLDVTASESALARVMAELGEDGASELALNAYEAVAADPQATTSQRLDAINSLVSTYCIVGDHQSAAPFSEQAVDLAQRASDRNLDALAVALYNRASVFLKSGDHARAAEAYRQTLALEEQLRGNDHLSLATTWNNLGSSLRRLGDDQGAEPAFRRALEILSLHLGDDHHRLAGVMNNLAGVVARRGEHGEAVELLRNARSIFASQVGGHHPNVLFLDLKIAQSRIADGEAAEVEAELRTMKSIWAERLGETHRNVLRIGRVRAEALMNLGHDHAAEPLLAGYIEAMREAGRTAELDDATELMIVLFERLHPGGDFEVAHPRRVAAAESS